MHATAYANAISDGYGECSVKTPLKPSAKTANRLQLKVRKRLGSFTLDASLALPNRGVSALFGVSGSGKTSLLRLVAGLDRPDTGSIQLGDRYLVDTARRIFVPPHQRNIGVVFQEARLFPHYRVRGNLTYGMPISARSRLEPIVDLLGIGALLDRMPGTLSGGEAQRVSIGRALLTDPALLLMDEPLTGLDGARKKELLDYLVALTRELEIPVVYISHDTQEISTKWSAMALISWVALTPSRYSRHASPGMSLSLPSPTLISATTKPWSSPPLQPHPALAAGSACPCAMSRSPSLRQTPPATATGLRPRSFR